MKVYYSLEEFSTLNNAVVTTGTFDGVHIGHRKILDQLNAIAQEHEGESVLLTFFPHPRMVLQPDVELKLLNTQAEKIRLLRETGLDHLIIHPFTKDFSRTKSLEFVRDILKGQIGATQLVIGYDHHFGRNREGSFEHLQEFGPLYGFSVQEIPAQDIKSNTVSSTKIRKALGVGDIKTANEYLNYYYPLAGKVVHGEKIGKSLGYPTANIILEQTYKLIPANGVYAVRLRVISEPEITFNAICNIGMRPTFSGKFKTIEIHILDFDKDLYGEHLEFEFIDRLRSEQKFEGKKELIEQIKTDEKNARNIFDVL